jgi:hypothetical protein
MVTNKKAPGQTPLEVYKPFGGPRVASQAFVESNSEPGNNTRLGLVSSHEPIPHGRAGGRFGGESHRDQPGAGRVPHFGFEGLAGSMREHAPIAPRQIERVLGKPLAHPFDGALVGFAAGELEDMSSVEGQMPKALFHVNADLLLRWSVGAGRSERKPYSLPSRNFAQPTEDSRNRHEPGMEGRGRDSRGTIEDRRWGSTGPEA